MRRQEPADFLDTYPIWLCDLHFAGRVYRIATEPVTVQDATGAALSYVGGLSVPEVEERIQLTNTDVPTRSASLALELPEAIGELRAAGHSLLYARADLYLTFCDVEARRLQVPESKLSHEELWHVISGRLTSPVWGIPGEPAGLLEFTVRQNPWDNRQPVVRPDLVVDSSRFDGSPGLPGPPPEDSDGKVMPLVIGAPGINTAPGVPLYALGRNGSDQAIQILLALGRLDQTEPVTVYDSSGNKESLSVLVFEDRHNTPVSYVLPTLAGSLSLTDERFWATFSAPALLGFGDGLVNPVRAAAYLFALSGDAVDLPAWLAVSDLFGGYEIGGYVNDDSTAWDVASRNLLSLVPVTYRYTRQGLTPVVYDPVLRAGQEAFEVDTVDTPSTAGAGDWSPLEGVSLEVEADEIPGQITIRYALDVRGNTFRRSRTWLSDRAAAAQPRQNRARFGAESLSLYLDQAQTHANDLATVELEASWVYADTTADLVLAWRSRLDTVARERTAYAAPWHWGHLQVGDVGRLSDAAKAWDRVFVMITGKTWDGSAWIFEVARFADPVTDRRA